MADLKCTRLNLSILQIVWETQLKKCIERLFKMQKLMHEFTCHQADHIRHQLVESQVFVQLFPHCSAAALQGDE